MDSTFLIEVPATIFVEGRLFSDARVSFTEHLSIGFVVLVEVRNATRELADEVLWVIFGTRVRYSAWSFDRLPTR